MLTQEQLEQRLKFVTGSDASVICGMSPYKTKLQLWMEKTGQVVAEDIGHLNHIKFGNFFERGVADWFESETGKKIITPAADMLVHKSFSWMAGNIDFKIKDENAILECKTAFRDGGWGANGDNTIPPHYLLQVAHYCAVGNFDKAYIAVVFAMTREMRWYQYDRNLTLEGKLITREKDFWGNHVLANVCPKPQTAQDILALYKETNATPIIADNEIVQLTQAYRTVCEAIKSNVEAKEIIKEKIQMYMRDADTLIDNSGTILASWKYTKPIQGFDKNILRRENPEIYEKFMLMGDPQRRFRLMGEKE